MVEILCTAFSYKELYKNYQKRVIGHFLAVKVLIPLDKQKEI